MTIEQLAALILDQTRARLAFQYSDEQASWEQVDVKPGPKYTKIDRGPRSNMSGMLMIENETGCIYGIKGYGRVHKGHFFGHLDTADEYYWGEYYPRKLTGSLVEKKDDPRALTGKIVGISPDGQDVAVLWSDQVLRVEKRDDITAYVPAEA